MRALIQRVDRAKVSVDGKTTGKIDRGILIFLGITHSDKTGDADYLVRKCLNMRIFEDENGRMNRSVTDEGGGVLTISQFTLYGDTAKGLRPSYSRAAPPEIAVPLYEYFIERIQKSGLHTASGIFGASMLVNIENRGPVTLMVDSK
jgi:D-tyrosyl-tRNA(Tyr) deacylase